MCVCLVSSPPFAISDSSASKARKPFVWKPKEVKSVVGDLMDEISESAKYDGLVVLDALDVLDELHVPDVPEAVDESALQVLLETREHCESEKYDAMLKNHHKVAVRKLFGSLCKCVGKLSEPSLG